MTSPLKNTGLACTFIINFSLITGVVYFHANARLFAFFILIFFKFEKRVEKLFP